MSAPPDALRRELALPLTLLAIDAALLVASGVAPYDRFTWFLEVAPFLIVVPILLATYRRFPLSRLLYILIFSHAIILMIGGHCTYARVPLGFWMRDVFHFLTRNDYDRIGHFAQGFVPAIAVREMLLRRSPLRRGKWLAFLTVAVCLAISGSAATAFLGTQGDPWDTQWDMFTCVIGAVTALLLLRRLHDRSLARLGVELE
jgi:putative membrane protein